MSEEEKRMLEIIAKSVFQLSTGIYKDKPRRLSSDLENELCKMYYKLKPNGNIYY